MPLFIRRRGTPTTPEVNPPANPENPAPNGANRVLPPTTLPEVPEASTEPLQAPRKKVIVIKKGVKTVDGVPVMTETAKEALVTDPSTVSASEIWGVPKVVNLVRRRNNLAPMGQFIVDAMQSAARRCNLKQFDPHLPNHRQELYIDMWLKMTHPGHEMETLRAMGKAKAKSEASCYMLEYYAQLMKIL